MSKFVPLNGFGRVEKEYITITEDSTLNFNIKTYTSEEELLAATPEENTIGIITSNNVTKWILDYKIPNSTFNFKASAIGYKGIGGGTITSDANYNIYIIGLDLTANKIKIELDGFGTEQLYHCFTDGSGEIYYDIPATNGLNVYEIPEKIPYIILTIPVQSSVFNIQSVYDGCIEGTLWIAYDTSGTTSFDMLDGDNRLQIYPLTARQYINNTWIDVYAKIYQNNKWINLWNGELYVDGHQYKEITGGWWQNPSVYRESYSTQGSLAFSKSIVMSAPKSQTTNATTRKKIDLTDYNQLIFDFSGNTSDVSEIYIHSLDSGRIDNSSLVVAKGTSSPISLAGVTGSYYISIIAWNERYPSFNNIKLIK